MRDSIRRPRDSYSEHGEDRWLLDHMGGDIPAGATFIDVGAHHPTRGSNTYLLYRLGASGLLIEPNLDFAPLLRRFRPRDVLVPVGCASETALRPYLRYSAAANSSFSSARVELNETQKGFRRVEGAPTPVLPLDILATAIADRPIILLSIDVEGLEDEVLDGGAATLARTEFVIIEALTTNPGMEERINDRLTKAGFEQIHSISWNRFYRRVDHRQST